jgi:hypothetical protein
MIRNFSLALQLLVRLGPGLWRRISTSHKKQTE